VPFVFGRAVFIEELSDFNVGVAAERRGILSDLSPEQLRLLRAHLTRRLAR